jgi:hypothetical protein
MTGAFKLLSLVCTHTQVVLANYEGRSNATATPSMKFVAALDLVPLHLIKSYKFAKETASQSYFCFLHNYKTMSTMTFACTVFASVT